MGSTSGEGTQGGRQAGESCMVRDVHGATGCSSKASQANRQQACIAVKMQCLHAERGPRCDFCRFHMQPLPSAWLLQTGGSADV